MADQLNDLQALGNDPEGLEKRYRQDREAFRAALRALPTDVQESVVFRVWRARLDYTKPKTDRTRLWWALGIAVVAAALVRVPAIWLGEEWYYPRLLPLWPILGAATYFWLAGRDRRTLIAGLVLTAVAVVYTLLLPGEDPYTDSVVMAFVHLPVLYWGFLGFVFVGSAWRDTEARIRYVRFNGELLILATLVFIGGMVFSGITVALFSLVFADPAEWYFPNVGVLGVAALPVAATYLYDAVFNKRTGIAPVLARFFSPLFLVMSCVYVMVALVGGQNPFEDREFLIVFNALLVVVLGMTVFSIAERGQRDEVGWSDYVNVALVIVTLVIDLVALSAILFRLASYGFTPNRVVVLGANLVAMAHLAWTCRAYVGLLRGRNDSAALQRAVALYLPVYVGWAAVVAFVLPLVFQFA